MQRSLVGSEMCIRDRFNINQTYFEDEATFVQKVETNNIISTYNVKVEYQACDDVVCIFREADLVFKFDGSKLKIQNQDLTSFVIEENNPLLLNLKDKQLLESINDSSDSFSSNSYLNLLILGFIGGLLALLTPCVFPMIPLTVSFFTNNESKSNSCLLYTSPSPRDYAASRMPSSA